MNYVNGTGLSKVLLLHENYYSFKHFMTDRLLQRSGIEKAKFFHAGINTPGLDRFIQEKGVKVVVPLGERALGHALEEYDILRWRGRAVQKDNYWVVPTFAPSKLLPHKGDDEDPESKMRHPPRFQGTWGRDVHFALQVAKEGYTRRVGRFIGDPPVEVFERFIEEYERELESNPLTYLSWDIETPYKLKNRDESDFNEEEAAFDGTILRVSFCFKPYYAISVAWAHPYLVGIRRLLGNRRNRGVVWNGATFDVPLVREVGVLVEGTVFDFMDGWHVIQSDLNKGLEFVSSWFSDLLPWKHLNNSDPLLYSCIDAHAALMNAIGITEIMHQRGCWDTFVNHSVRLMPVLRDAGQRGNAVDKPFQDQLKSELDAEKERLIASAQGMVPEVLKPRHRYKTDRTLPEVVQLAAQVEEVGVVTSLDGRKFEKVMEPNEVNVCTKCGAVDVTKGEHTGRKTVSKTLRAENHHPKKCRVATPLIGWEDGQFPPVCSCPKGWPKKEWDVVENPCYKAELKKETHPTMEWDEILPFNPNSGDQIRSYIKFYNHPMGTDKKDASKETADKKHLKKLMKEFGEKHPIYGVGVEMSAVTKTRGTYCPEPDEHGRIHTEYVNSPSTWRLGSRKTARNGTNMQNWGKREENLWAKRARQQIIATPGTIEFEGPLPEWAVERREVA